jgi:hypothetical protein
MDSHAFLDLVLLEMGTSNGGSGDVAVVYVE